MDIQLHSKMRNERRKQAEARLEEYNKLSLQEKLDRLPVNGSKKQRARLLAALEKQKTTEESKVHAHPTPEEMGVKVDKKTKKQYSEDVETKSKELFKKAKRN